MKTILFRGILLVICFAAVFALLSVPDYMQLFHLRGLSDSTEKKLGSLLWEAMEGNEHVIANDSITNPIDKLVKRIAQKNHIEKPAISIHIIENSTVNAFAMPDHQLIIYSGLINCCDNENELAGVIAHEMAHIEKSHVMKKLVEEFGLSILMSMASGGRNTHTLQQIGRMLSSSAYDRTLESEADIIGAGYMINAGMDPAKLADFLYKLASDEQQPYGGYWISTHPESTQRAAAIITFLKDKKYDKRPVLTPSEWRALKKAARN